MDEQRDRRAQPQVFHPVYRVYVRLVHPFHGRHRAVDVRGAEAPEDEHQHIAELLTDRKWQKITSEEAQLKRGPGIALGTELKQDSWCV